MDAAAGRLVEAAGLLFWSRSAGHPSPLDAMTALLARRLDSAFRRAELTREVLDDDGDEPRRVARWLVLPDTPPPGARPGFPRGGPGLVRRSVRGPGRYVREGFGWADVLGVSPPFDPDQVRAAYRARSRSAHPDAGGTDAQFVRLNEAYEERGAYFADRGL